MSRRDRRLIESAAMLLPSVVVKRCDMRPCADWNSTSQRRMCAMRIIEVLEVRQLLLQVTGGPEQHPIQALASKRADQPFDIRMGHRNVRNCLDLGRAPHPKIGLPSVNRYRGSLSELRYFELDCPRTAWLNMQHAALPSTIPAWTPKPTIRLVNWSMTTNTQCVRSSADSHRNMSTLHRLSFA